MTPEYKPVRVRAGVALVALGLFAIQYTLMLAIALYVPSDAQWRTMSDAEYVAQQATVARLATVEERVMAGSMPLIAVGAIAWLAWAYRAHTNLRALGHRPKYKPSAAIGYWFVPFANLIVPYYVTSEAWSLSGSLGPDHAPPTDGGDGLRDPIGDPEDVEAADTVAAFGLTPSAPWWLAIWWAAWLVRGAWGRALDADAGASLGTVAAHDAFCLLATGLAMAVVVGISRRQERTAARLALDSTSPVAF